MINDEIKPMLSKSEAKPCENKSMRWLCRVLLLIFTSVLLLSMLMCAWNQYNDFMYEDDNEIPKPLAMLNECLNQSWNIVSLENRTYEILYYENELQDKDIFVDSVCKLELKFPFIHMNDSNCCRVILWNTI